MFQSTTTPVVETTFAVGDTVKVNLPGSMYDRKPGTITALNADGSAATVEFSARCMEHGYRAGIFPTKYLVKQGHQPAPASDPDYEAWLAKVAADAPALTGPVYAANWMHNRQYAPPVLFSQPRAICPQCQEAANLNGDAICWECDHAEPAPEDCEVCHYAECQCRYNGPDFLGIDDSDERRAWQSDDSRDDR